MKNKILLIFISLASLILLSCSEKIHGLSKYNGNTYVSSTAFKMEIEIIEPAEPPEEPPPELITEDSEYIANKNKVYSNEAEEIELYLWLYIYEGEAYFMNSTSQTERPDFYTGFYNVGCLMGLKDNTYLIGSGTTYETPDNDLDKITLEFSKDGNSIIYTYTNKYYSEENKSLELVIFK